MLKRMYDLQKKKGKKGFSMIELIIVLAIMAILVALIGTQLIPYLEKSRQNRDQTTLDTLKTAYESVVADYEIPITVAAGATKTMTYSDLSTYTGAQEDFLEYAGLDAADEPFKSKIANNGATKSTISNVNFIYNDNNVMEDVQVEKLSLVNGEITTP